MVDNNSVAAGNNLTFLGMVLDSNLRPTPYINSLIAECRRRLGMIKLVNSRLGRQNVLDVVNGLLMGKMAYLLAHCFGVRLEEDNGATGRAKKLQVIISAL